jgi:hypothetical protein
MELERSACGLSGRADTGSGTVLSGPTPALKKNIKKIRLVNSDPV